MDLQTALPRVLCPAQGRGALWRPKFVSAQTVHLPWRIHPHGPCQAPVFASEWRSHEGQRMRSYSEGSGLGSKERGARTCQGVLSLRRQVLLPRIASDALTTCLACAQVHRLDQPTGGLIMVAKTRPALAALSAAFSHREVKKAYLAIVCGRWNIPSCSAHDTLDRLSSCSTYKTVDRLLLCSAHDIIKHLLLCLAHSILGHSISLVAPATVKGLLQGLPLDWQHAGKQPAKSALCEGMKL